MKIVIDTNILISALIRNSVTRKLITKSGWEFYYPEMSLHEIRNYKGMILEKSGMAETEYTDLFNKLLSYIKLVPDRWVNLKLEEAKAELDNIDPDDAVFLAAALSLENSMIWSNDADFDRQDKVEVLKTKDVISLLKT